MLYKSLIDSGLKYVSTAESKTPYFGRHWLLENRGEIDVIHFHFIQPFYNYETTHARLLWVLRFALNLLLARVLGFRTVFTAHDLTATFPLQPYWVDYLGHWAAVNLTNIVLVHCAPARDAITRLYGRRSGVELITHPNFIGVYPDDIRQDKARATLGLQQDDKVFLFFGGVRPNKGIDVLIQVFKRIPGEHLRLIIAGQPQPGIGYDSVISKLAESDPRIILMLRYIADDEVQVLMHGADIVVLPFSRILTSSSVMLALSFGKPVIVPDMGCLPELVSHDIGYTYRPHDEESLRQTILECASTPDIQLMEMGMAARQKVAPFTAALLAQQTLAAYMGGH
jgi:beta-1,4-mannosyltransferase